MKLRSDKLADHLSAAKGLAPVYVICGDDPLMTGEYADAIRRAARTQGFTERESHAVTNANQFDWQLCFAGLDNLSLFASRKIFELRIPNGKPGREGGAALTDMALSPAADTLYLIHLPKLDKRSKTAKWATSLERAGVWIDVWDPEAAELPGWLSMRATRVGLTLDREAAVVLAARTEGNLLAAQQELDRLALLMPGAAVTAGQIADSVADGARFNVFQLAEAAVGQDVKRALRILFGLRREGTADALICWALTREASTLVNVWMELQTGNQSAAAFKKCGIWNARQPAYNRALRAHSEASVRRLARCAGETDRTVKGARYGSSWGALLELVLRMAQPRNPVLVSN